ncbi:hypothetical protein DEO72_LG5g504 [Vigna unguiculata]|uniref:Uncharacterized protein n=1 Tax=Vigna unguiculata TaxID=3917 RepID=A0A4D6LVI1_VIGUN|nr:hypothetical protein DEO72_LG5g504 [Vigna unguiculata]
MDVYCLPGLHMQQRASSPMRPRLSEPLSPERDGVSLKTRALCLSESSSASSDLFLQVSPR